MLNHRPNPTEALLSQRISCSLCSKIFLCPLHLQPALYWLSYFHLPLSHLFYVYSSDMVGVNSPFLRGFYLFSILSNQMASFPQGNKLLPAQIRKERKPNFAFLQKGSMLGVLALKSPHGRISGTDKSWLVGNNRIYFFASEGNGCEVPKRPLSTHFCPSPTFNRSGSLLPPGLSPLCITSGAVGMQISVAEVG